MNEEITNPYIKDIIDGRAVPSIKPRTRPPLTRRCTHCKKLTPARSYERTPCVHCGARKQYAE